MRAAEFRQDGMLRTVWWWTEKDGGAGGLLLVETASVHSPFLVTVNSIAPALCQTETKRDWVTMEHGEVRCLSMFDY